MHYETIGDLPDYIVTRKGEGLRVALATDDDFESLVRPLWPRLSREYDSAFLVAGEAEIVGAFFFPGVVPYTAKPVHWARNRKR